MKKFEREMFTAAANSRICQILMFLLFKSRFVKCFVKNIFNTLQKRKLQDVALIYLRIDWLGFEKLTRQCRVASSVIVTWISIARWGHAYITHVSHRYSRIRMFFVTLCGLVAKHVVRVWKRINFMRATVYNITCHATAVVKC